MLESVEIILNYQYDRPYIAKLIQKLNKYNFDQIELTVHLEDRSARLRLISLNTISSFDQSLAIREFCQVISKILDNQGIKHTVIETMSPTDPMGNSSVYE